MRQQKVATQFLILPIKRFSLLGPTEESQTQQVKQVNLTVMFEPLDAAGSVARRLSADIL